VSKLARDDRAGRCQIIPEPLYLERSKIVVSLGGWGQILKPLLCLPKKSPAPKGGALPSEGVRIDWKAAPKSKPHDIVGIPLSN
jgi:hypothetical protein